MNDINNDHNPSYDTISCDTSTSDTFDTSDISETFSPDTTLETTLESSCKTELGTILENDSEEPENININETEYIEEENKDCVICLENGNLIRNPFCNCNFFFHEQCYATWLLNNHKCCIVCKKNIVHNCIVSVLNIDDEGFINSLEENTNNIIQQEPPRLNRISNNYEYRTNRVHNASIYVRPLEVLETQNPQLLRREAQNIINRHNANNEFFLGRRGRKCLLFVVIGGSIASGIALFCNLILNL